VKLGRYSIGDPIVGRPEARKFGWWDNRLERRKTPGETLYKAPERVEFLNAFWYLVPGVFQEHIYRLSARFSTNHKDEMESVVCRCGQMQGDKTDAAIWDTTFGRITLNIQSVNHGGKESMFVV